MATSATPRSISASRAHALSHLLARYITGQVAEAQLADFTDLFDEADVSADERAAFAHFYLDALMSEGEVKMPKADELADVLAIARA